jgi:hypothetical protein
VGVVGRGGAGDGEGGVVGVALAVGGRVGLRGGTDSEVRTALLLQLCPQLIDELILAVVFLLQCKGVRLEGQLLEPNPAVVFPCAFAFRRIRQEVINKRR